ncbi:hypothetical protein QYE76_070794 [Lolium multiflorum]|uniref:Transposase (putative) gypsy type domain-containing protein n=1 Tax=Lolium multiflorum TaxID=4521 RepID=A0AAD8SJY6_LOLMU|nr:hypothetical protein QYE76_070794 [Lolium multiflorum]
MSTDLYLTESTGSSRHDENSDGLTADLAQSEAGTSNSVPATGNQGEAGSSSRSTGVDLDSYTRGAWMGSDVTQADIDWLYRSRRIPEEVWCRIPGEQHQTEPQPGEVVVFTAHFERGLGLPALDFFRRFLDFYELQPHHLPGNAIFYLSSFTAFMEGYCALCPVRGLHLVSPFRKQLIQTLRYGLRPDLAEDLLLRPERRSGRLHQSSGVCSRATLHEELAPQSEDDKESIRIAVFIDINREETNLCAEDLVRVFLARRVLPLQRRAHKISEMSGPMDLTRITTHRLSPTVLVLKAKQIC